MLSVSFVPILGKHLGIFSACFIAVLSCACEPTSVRPAAPERPLRAVVIRVVYRQVNAVERPRICGALHSRCFKGLPELPVDGSPVAPCHEYQDAQILCQR